MLKKIMFCIAVLCVGASYSAEEEPPSYVEACVGRVLSIADQLGAEQRARLIRALKAPRDRDSDVIGDYEASRDNIVSATCMFCIKNPDGSKDAIKVSYTFEKKMMFEFFKDAVRPLFLQWIKEEIDQQSATDMKNVLCAIRGSGVSFTIADAFERTVAEHYFKLAIISPGEDVVRRAWNRVIERGKRTVSETCLEGEDEWDLEEGGVVPVRFRFDMGAMVNIALQSAYGRVIEHKRTDAMLDGGRLDGSFCYDDFGDMHCEEQLYDEDDEMECFLSSEDMRIAAW